MGLCQPWATSEDLHGPCAGESGIDEALIDQALEVASEVVYVLSGRQFPGECDGTLHPCPDRRHTYRTEPASWSNHSSLGHPGSWATGVGARWLRCRHRRGCGCAPMHALDLGVAPLLEVASVVIDGEELDGSAYRIDNGRELVRVDGEPWPGCVDHADPEAFAVTAKWGQVPPTAGVRAAAALACQLALASDPAKVDDCALPERVTNITRQGLSMVVLDPFEMLDEGKVGVYEVDLFLKAYNPNQLARRATVMSPDVKPKARRVGT